MSKPILAIHVSLPNRIIQRNTVDQNIKSGYLAASWRRHSRNETKTYIATAIRKVKKLPSSGPAGCRGRIKNDLKVIETL